MKFSKSEIPIAYSMISLGKHLAGMQSHPAQEFACYWWAFNAIYVKTAELVGKTPAIRLDQDGIAKMRQSGSVFIPKIVPIREWDQIESAINELADETIFALIDHSSTLFFFNRTPHRQGILVPRDSRDQALNGVLNVGYSVDANYPVWSPIDRPMYEAYQDGDRRKGVCDLLSRQILKVLYTVRNNTFHGGKNADNANDMEVLVMALSLLKLVVCDFVHMNEFEM